VLHGGVTHQVGIEVGDTGGGDDDVHPLEHLACSQVALQDPRNSIRLVTQARVDLGVDREMDGQQTDGRDVVPCEFLEHADLGAAPGLELESDESVASRVRRSAASKP
jgi:hypothetical protein